MNDVELWLFRHLGSPESSLSPWMRLLLVVGIIIGAFVVDMLVRHAIIPGIRKLASRTKTQWDDIMLSDKVCAAASALLPPIILTAALPYALQGWLEEVVGKVTLIYIIFNACRFISAICSSVYEIFIYEEHARARSLRGVVQTIQIIAWLVGIILIISALLGRSPLYLITGLGAAATVMMLIFQDSIKGLVAGIQLSMNDMVRVGEWISMPSRGVDGIVTEITLSTVKVQNWDNTLMTIQPYSLLTDTFQNWRGMTQSGGRRITRSINVNMNSVHFLNADEVRAFQAAGHLPATAQPGACTNLEAYRNCLSNHLHQLPELNTDMTLMVRQLEPTAEGIPVQIYGFSRTKVWEEYEGIQARLVEYMVSLMPQFDILPYQRSSDKPLNRNT